MRGVVLIVICLLAAGFVSGIRMDCYNVVDYDLVQQVLATGRYSIIGMTGPPPASGGEINPLVFYPYSKVPNNPGLINGWLVCGFEDAPPEPHTDYPYEGCDRDFFGNPLTSHNFLDYRKVYNSGVKKWYMYVRPPETDDDDSCIAAVYRNMTCGEVPAIVSQPGATTCNDNDWQACVGKYKRTSDYYYACDDIMTTDPDTVVCCNVSQEKIVTQGFGYTNLTPKCEGGTMPYCEEGESIDLYLWYFPINYPANAWVFWNSSNTTCTINWSAMASIRGMDYLCQRAPCNQRFLIEQIPAECRLAPMNSTDLYLIITNDLYTPLGNFNFTFGYHLDY
ncbi:MAG: hypothetical protein ABIJ21_05285, partial [Nanoarchaeota archaeon]